MYDRDLSPKHVEGDTGSPPYPASTPVDDDHLHHKDRHLQEDNEISCESAQPIMIVPCTKDRDIEEARLMMMPCGNSEVKESSVTRLDGQSIHAIPPPPMPFEGSYMNVSLYYIFYLFSYFVYNLNMEISVVTFRANGNIDIEQKNNKEIN